MNQAKEKEISVEQFKFVIKKYFLYFVSKWKVIGIVVFLSGLVGMIYAWRQKPLYIAEITFATESEGTSTAGSYAALAAQLGLDAGGGGAFEGENLIELLKSRLLVEKTFLTPVDIEGKSELLINYYIRVNKYDKAWAKDTALNRVKFISENDPPNRKRDSILKSFSKNITTASLEIYKRDKKLDIITAKMKDYDEAFAKIFIEELVNNVIRYYTDYKSRKSRENVLILKRQVDSIRSMLTGNIVEIAVSNDLNVNPARQVMRTNVQKRQVDVQVNSALYGELVKNLELSKIALRKQMPLIQIIDEPKLPLDKKKMGRMYGAFAFAFVGGVLIMSFFFFKKLLRI